jgi:hypothetical protein
VFLLTGSRYHKVYHGKSKDWKKEPTKKSPLSVLNYLMKSQLTQLDRWYNVPPDPAKLKKSVVALRDPPNMQPDPDDSYPLNFDTFVPSHDPSLAQALQPALEPSGIPPVPGEYVSRDEAFNRALGAMYWTGYWTAVYHVRPPN